MKTGNATRQSESQSAPFAISTSKPLNQNRLPFNVRLDNSKQKRIRFPQNTPGSSNYTQTTWLHPFTISLVFLAFLFHLLGLSTTHWASIDSNTTPGRRRNEHLGLWRVCVDSIVSVGGRLSLGTDDCDDFVDTTYSDWLKASQSFMVLAFFAFLPTTCYVVLSSISVNLSRRISTYIIASLGLFLTGLFQLVSVLIFGGMYHTYFERKEQLWSDVDVACLDWSFVITCLSSVTCFISSGLLGLVWWLRFGQHENAFITSLSFEDSSHML